MKFSNYDFIKRWEGLELEAYKDIAGIWTIGYGHTARSGNPPTPVAGMKISADEAKAIQAYMMTLYNCRHTLEPVTDQEAGVVI